MRWWWNEVASRLVGDNDRGLADHRRAIATRCRSPPESCRALCSTRCSRRTRRSAATAVSRRRAAGTPRYSKPIAAFSAAVSESMRKNCWKTIPTPSGAKPGQGAVAQPGDLLPRDRTDPVVGRSSAAIRCTRVDLPDPDGPVTRSSRRCAR